MSIYCMAQQFLYPTHIFANIVSYVWAKFETRLRISKPYDMFEARLHARASLHFGTVYFMCIVSMSRTAHWLRTPQYNRGKSWVEFFFSLHFLLHSCTQRSEKKKVKYTCHVYFFLCFSSSSFDTSNRLNAYLSLRWYFAYSFVCPLNFFSFCCSAFRSSRTKCTCKKVVRI